MKFLPLGDFSTASNALNFDTPDLHVTGSCDLYTTKAAGSDKKLYKAIDQKLEEQHAQNVELGNRLSPDGTSLSRQSPFGDLSVLTNRKTYAYLIATLNASHPDYDFSHVLRPADFRHEHSFRHVMNNFDSLLDTSRPGSSLTLGDGCGPSSFTSRSFGAGSPHGSKPLADAAGNPVWGSTMWSMIDKEMALAQCAVFAYKPETNPFEEEDGSIWSMHYLFFNKQLKRVAYLYVRAVPVLSASPQLRPRRGSNFRGMHAADGAGTSKRAEFWFGDRLAERMAADDEFDLDDGLVWNRNADGRIVSPYDPDSDPEDDWPGDSDDEMDMDEEEDPKTRSLSEDIIEQMEIE